MHSSEAVGVAAIVCLLVILVSIQICRARARKAAEFKEHAVKSEIARREAHELLAQERSRSEAKINFLQRQNEYLRERLAQFHEESPHRLGADIKAIKREHDNTIRDRLSRWFEHCAFR